MIDNSFYVPERALVIVAHADDIEFGIAGTVARWTDAGAHVTYCIVTDSSSGSNEPDMDLAALIETRRTEQLAAAAVVGVTDVRFLDYRDGTVVPTLDLRRDLTRIVRAVRPQVVVTFDPRTFYTPDLSYINHPDHRAVGEAALYAVFPCAETRPIFPELLAEGLEPHKVERLYMVLSEADNLVVDVTPVIDRKIEALACHESQVDAETIAMVRTWNRIGGARYGLPFAETFRMMQLNHAPQEG
jgi:LmbE family N-acetylglucosaminyl deacetylase